MTVLDEIIEGVRADMAERAERVSIADLEKMIERAPQPRSPLAAFRSSELSVISEVKRSSPSKGALADIPEPAVLASAYEAGGASAISVLTEKHKFNGSLADLDAVRAAVNIPVLRKDFVVDEYMLYEARAHGADLALLIVTALDDKELNRLYKLALNLGLTPLVEVHTEDEARRARNLGAEVVGVNNRNLKTLDVDLEQFSRLVGLLDDQAIKVAESGILSPKDAARVASEGADVILVGEALVKNSKPSEAVAAMIQEAKR